MLSEKNSGRESESEGDREDKKVTLSHSLENELSVIFFYLSNLGRCRGRAAPAFVRTTGAVQGGQNEESKPRLFQGSRHFCVQQRHFRQVFRARRSREDVLSAEVRFIDQARQKEDPGVIPVKSDELVQLGHGRRLVLFGQIGYQVSYLCAGAVRSTGIVRERDGECHQKSATQTR